VRIDWPAGKAGNVAGLNQTAWLWLRPYGGAGPAWLGI